MKISYTTSGNVRGACGHNHRSLIAAHQCQARDSRDCKAARGYSDRRLFVVEDGTARPVEANDMSAADARAMGYTL